MPIKISNGDIFQSTALVLVNPVNCHGPMGAGLAKQFSKKFPGLERDYRLAITGMKKSGHPMIPGDIYWWRTVGYPTRYIANLATKDHWKDSSRLNWVVEGMRNLVHACKVYRARPSEYSLALPPLGCGLGGLKWSGEEGVKKVITHFSREILSIVGEDALIEIYEPGTSLGVK